MSILALATARSVGSTLAACAERALLAAHPDRYELWAAHVGPDHARVQLVDCFSRTSRLLQRIGAGELDASTNLVELEMPVRALLVQLVAWSGALPLPDSVTAAAQGLVPLLGVSNRDRGGFEAYEAPTIPTPSRSSNALESLEDDLVDEGSEVRLLLEQLVKSSELHAAIVGYRSGDAIAGAGCSVENETTGARTDSEAEMAPLVTDLLETSDLYFSMRVDGGLAAVRLTGTHAMLVATGPTQRSIESLREPGLGYTLDRLLESFQSRVHRTSSPPTLAPNDDPPPRSR